MDKYSRSNFKRNSEVIKSYFKVVKDITICTANLRVIFPERYIKKEFVFMGSTVRLVNIFAIVDDNNNYAIAMAPIFIEVAPYNVSDVMIDNELNKVLHFRKDDVFIVNNTCVISDSFIYDLFDEFYVKGNIPWFMNYDDVSDILVKSKLYAGSNIGDNPITYEILAASISRYRNDKNQFIRHVMPSSKVDVEKLDVAYVGLNNVYYSFDSTGASLFGGYAKAGTVKALVNPEKTSTTTMNILRS